MQTALPCQLFPFIPWSKDTKAHHTPACVQTGPLLTVSILFLPSSASTFAWSFPLAAYCSPGTAQTSTYRAWDQADKTSNVFLFVFGTQSGRWSSEPLWNVKLNTFYTTRERHSAPRRNHSLVVITCSPRLECSRISFSQNQIVSFGVNFWWLLKCLLSHNNDEASVYWLWAHWLTDHKCKAETGLFWLLAFYYSLNYITANIRYAWIISKWKNISLALLLEMIATCMSHISMPLSACLPPCRKVGEDKMRSCSPAWLHLPTKSTFLPLFSLIPLPQGTIALIIFTLKISFSSFSLRPSQYIPAITEHKLIHMQSLKSYLLQRQLTATCLHWIAAAP